MIYNYLILYSIILFVYIYIRFYLHNYTHIYIRCPPNKHRPSKPPIHFMSLVKRPVCAARQSVFNDLNLDNDVTLISFFRRPHLISFCLFLNKVQPKKYCKLVRLFDFHFGPLALKLQ